MKDEMRRELKSEIKKASGVVWLRSTGYVLAGLGVVVGLAWNDAVQALVKSIFVLESDTIIAKFVYALVITAVLVFVSSWIEKRSEK